MVVARWVFVSLAVSLNAGCPAFPEFPEFPELVDSSECVEDLDCSLSGACEADADCDGTACTSTEVDENGEHAADYVCPPADVLGSVCVATARGGRCGIEANSQGRCAAALYTDEFQSARPAEDIEGNTRQVCEGAAGCTDDGECAL